MQTAKQGDLYAVKDEKYNKWIVVQIIKEDTNKVAAVVLDWFKSNLPKVNEINSLKPLILNHHMWNNQKECYWLNSKTVPHNFLFIENTELLYITKIITGTGYWNSLLWQQPLQYLWDKLPEQTRIDFKKARNSNDREVNKTNLIIDRKENDSFWKNVAQFKALYKIECNVWDDQLIPFIEKNKIITELQIENHNQKSIDLSKTGVQKLIINVTGLETLILNEQIYFISFIGNVSKLKTIKHSFNGQFISIYFYLSFPKKLTGINNAEDVSFVINKQIDFKNIFINFPNVKKLYLSGKPGTVSSIYVLKNNKNIQTLHINDVYGYTAADFPSLNELPNLEDLSLTNIPKDVGIKAKKEFKNISELYISQLRDEEWLKTNLDNPFRDWDGRDGVSKAIASKAIQTYVNIRKKLIKAKTIKEKEIYLKAFVETFNEIDRKKSIDTIEREEIYEVFMDLAIYFKMDEKSSEALFESLRNF